MVKAKNISTLFKISPPSFDPTHPFILKISQPASSEKIRVNLKPPLFQGGGVPTMKPKVHRRKLKPETQGAQKNIQNLRVHWNKLPETLGLFKTET